MLCVSERTLYCTATQREKRFFKCLNHLRYNSNIKTLFMYVTAILTYFHYYFQSGHIRKMLINLTK